MTPFEKAFATARKDKKATFSFNGKSYTTQLRGEGAVVKPKARPGDKGKPTAMTEAPKQGTPPKSSPTPKTRPAGSSAAPASSPRPQAKPVPKAASMTASPPPKKPTMAATDWSKVAAKGAAGSKDQAAKDKERAAKAKAARN